MRRFLNVSKQRQKELEAQFPNLIDLVQVNETTEYTYLAVSIFDHWLTREESMDLLADLDRNEIERRTSIFDEFNQLLLEKTEVLTFRFRGMNGDKPKFKSFVSKQAQSSYIRQTDMGMYKTVLPELNAVYFEGYDDTNIFYLQDLTVKSFIESCASKVGLHCLEHW
ncbi:MAG: hypothetical protein CMK63_12415 [Pseudoalteromonadaceae bacterium]|nr:hypothetical protein [Pseudoalteromonadaceae bacterium]|tara:strand:+ start:564 stop:1064 length:501 start_codon:yes stop_codon:yes gene_type:complete